MGWPSELVSLQYAALAQCTAVAAWLLHASVARAACMCATACVWSVVWPMPCLLACCSAVPAHAQAAAGRGRCGKRLCRCPRGTRGRWSWCARPLTRATTHRWVAGGLSAAAALMLGLEGGCLSPAADEDVHAFVFESIALLLLRDLAAAGGRGGDLEPARRQLQLLAPRGRDGRVNAMLTQ